MDTPASPLAGALAYAKRGWPVFPVKENKQPAIKDWKTKATTDEKQIRRWFERDFIGGCNFGFQPGLAGVAVIDIDRGKKRKREDGTEETVNGEDSLADFLKQSGEELPQTYTVRTPSGGTHLYFKADGIGNKNGFLPAVDVKSCGGFVVVPGSGDSRGAYVVELDVPVAELPGVLADACRRGFPKKETVTQTAGVPGDWIDFASVLETIRTMDPVLCGTRDTRLFAICAEWKERGVTLEGMRQLLRLMNDLGKIEAGDDPLDEHDFDRISRSAWSRKETAFGTKSVGALLSDQGEPESEGYSAAEIPGMEIQPVDFLVHDLVPAGLSIMGGAAKSGKTYLLLQLAVSLASGTPFLGRDVPKRRRILYYYLEGGRGQVKKRFGELYGTDFQPPADLIFAHRLPRLGCGGLAVLEKRVGFKLAQKDVFLNIAGGLRVNDPAIDLGVISAILSSNMDSDIEPLVCMAGEVGLSGEIRPVNRIEQRISEAEKLGFKSILIPKQNMQGLDCSKVKIELVGVRKVEEAFRFLFG